jgi:hypothetical protein
MIDYYKEEVINALREYIESEKALRARPESWAAYHSDNPEFLAICKRHRDASKELWAVTDCEYNEDGFRELIWKWRYLTVMARKCCWYQRNPLTYHLSGQTMKKVHLAEYELVKACGLLDCYESPNVAIERQFPNLCSYPPETTTIITSGSWWSAVKNWLATIGR